MSLFCICKPAPNDFSETGASTIACRAEAAAVHSLRTSASDMDMQCVKQHLIPHTMFFVLVPGTSSEFLLLVMPDRENGTWQVLYGGGSFQIFKICSGKILVKGTMLL